MTLSVKDSGAWRTITGLYVKAWTVTDEAAVEVGHI